MGYGSADYLHTMVEAMKLAYADRDTYYADPAFVKMPAEGLLSKAYAKERAALIDPKHASHAFVAGDPLPFDSQVKDVAVLDRQRQRRAAARPPPTRIAVASLGLDSAGVSKDTTHMAIIDKDGNIFDATPSGGWIRGAVILGDTGIGMSVRGEQFWLDKTRAEPAASACAAALHADAQPDLQGRQPMMALGTPGGDNQDQTILQAFLEHRRILARLVSEPARGVRMAARPDAAFLWIVLAARARVQQAQRRGDDSGRRLQRTAGARSRRQPVCGRSACRAARPR